ncbi:sodium- and chloride-dependent taurine transporter-like [Pecten maximus]|uniref:sodium- and chloride-dependent taurine transporter-like n=1 Tax=Pecten maximus TaxID=6579 RepID=UPI001458441A|nr:sodium- and chloride-dependent taurine transporter-like [Pecten maximus]
MAKEGRGNWNNWYEFIFSCIGLTVGLGNIWRFPYICYKNGGGAFLIPYFIFLFVIGLPEVFLQFTYAQYSNLGPGKIWECCPLFRGIGYGMITLTWLIGIYYGVIIAWTLYYFGMSFSATLPWATCDNPWNTPSCYIRGANSALNETVNRTMNGTVTTALTIVTNGTNVTARTPPEEFWERHVLELTDSIEDLGSIRWQLVLCLLATSITVFLCLAKGIKSSGKVMYVAATVPYLFLLTLLIRGLFLPGALDGLKFYLIPRWERLLDFNVWVDAAVQTFFSASIGMGALIGLASFNKFSNNHYRDALIVPVLDAVTSMFAGCTIFVTLGYMANQAGVDIEKVVEQGPGIAFMVYPEALSTLPLPQLWSVLFFIMLFTVGLDSQIVHIQLVAVGLMDRFKIFRDHETLTMAFLNLLSFIIGLIFVTQGGMYVLQLVDWYVASISTMFLAFLEVTALAYFYGVNRLYKDIEMMLGYKPCPGWKAFWLVITPLMVLVLWLVSVSQHKAVSYGKSTYPDWSIGIGWVIAIAPLIPIPISAIWTICEGQGSIIDRLRDAVKPTTLWKPAEDCRDEWQCQRQTLTADIVMQPI